VVVKHKALPVFNTLFSFFFKKTAQQKPWALLPRFFLQALRSQLEPLNKKQTSL